MISYKTKKLCVLVIQFFSNAAEQHKHQKQRKAASAVVETSTSTTTSTDTRTPLVTNATEQNYYQKQYQKL